MTRRTRWWLVGVVAVAEVWALRQHDELAWKAARVTYHTLWKYAPRPAGMEDYQPPDRFAK